MIINWEEIENLVGRVAAQYEKSAPLVAEHMDDLALRLAEKPEHVSLYELTQVEMLRENGIWEQPNFASNRIYKLRAFFSMDTTGHAGF